MYYSSFTKCYQLIKIQWSSKSDFRFSPSETQPTIFNKKHNSILLPHILKVVLLKMIKKKQLMYKKNNCILVLADMLVVK